MPSAYTQRSKVLIPEKLFQGDWKRDTSQVTNWQYYGIRGLKARNPLRHTATASFTVREKRKREKRQGTAMPLTCPYPTRTLFSRPTPRLLRNSLLSRHSSPSTRQFSISPAAMAIKTYFDLTWEGPVMNQSGKPTTTIQGEFGYKFPPCTTSKVVWTRTPTDYCAHHQLNPVASTSPCTTMLSLRPPRTSVLSALARKVSDTRAPSSTVSSQTSCFREATSPAVM